MILEVAEPKTKTLSSETLYKVNNYWFAAIYLSVGQIYLHDNPLLRKTLTLEDFKPRLMGHWGTTPGLKILREVLNDLDRFHLVDDVIDRLPSLGSKGAYAKQYLRNKLLDHKVYIDQYSEDMPEIRN